MDNIANALVVLQSGVPDASDFPGSAGVVIDTDTGILYFRNGSGEIGIVNASGGAQTLTDQATITWNVNRGAVATVTLAGNRTMAAPTNLRNGAAYILTVVQDGTGSRTLTWNSIFKWEGGTAPTLTTTAGAYDIFTFVSDGTNLRVPGFDVK